MSNSSIYKTAIAAVNIEGSIRVYYQNSLGNILEASYDNGWKNTNSFGQAKLGSPIAATLKKGSESRIFYLSTDNKLREIVFVAGKGWTAGPINAKNFAVAPSSKIAALVLPEAYGGGVRIYVQNENNTIQEYGLDNATTWFKSSTNLGVALAGTALAAAVFSKPTLTIRVFFQTENLKLFEKAYDVTSNKWIDGSDTKLTPPAGASLSIVSWGTNSLFIRLFTTTASNEIVESCLDNHFSDGGTRRLSSTISGTQSAAVAWGNSETGNLEMRLFFQAGTAVTGISEWSYSTAASAWHMATPAIGVSSEDVKDGK